MISLEEYLGQVREEGVELRGNQLCSSTIKKCIREHGTFATRKAFAGSIPDILEKTVERYSETPEKSDKVKGIKNSFENKNNLTIEELVFYNPNWEEKPIRYITNPVLNNAANTVILTTLPLTFAKMLVNNPYLKNAADASLPFAMGMKFLNKFYKECRKEEKDMKRVFKYLMSGIGGLLLALPIKPGNDLIYQFVYAPFISRYLQRRNLAESEKKDKARETYEELPPFSVIKVDLCRLIKEYNSLKSKYKSIEMERVSKEDITSKINAANIFLKHHLKHTKLEEIDLDIDVVVSTAYRILGEPTAFADLMTNTIELSYFAIKNTDMPAMIRTYIGETMRIDQTRNEGVRMFRTDRVLEDLAVYYPDKGYDYEMTRERLTAAGFAYALFRKKELTDQITAKTLIEKRNQARMKIVGELTDYGMDTDIAEKCVEMAIPTKIQNAVPYAYHLFGVEDPIGYCDFYRLLKYEKVM